ncbi:MAG: DUF2750 domain-containing protein [Coriobacteriia bacterium]|nr:DUF2750 domain-containing protein [Coriobacteriia bacterium]
MDTRLIGRLEDFAPPWLRYMLTLSEAARTGETWVVASGEDIALWDTDGGAVLPDWPTKALAANVAEGEAEAAPLAVDEWLNRLLPFLIEGDANVSLFPNFEDDMLVEPTAVAEDLTDLLAEPSDLAAELVAEPLVAAYDEWALLESPGVEEEPAEGWAPNDEVPAPSGDRYADALAAAAATDALWLLDDPSEDAIVGLVIDDRPSLTLFTSEAQAAEYGEGIDADVVPRAIQIDVLVRGWLLVAYGGQWSVALSPDETDAVFAEPTRVALDLSEACNAAAK